MSSEKKNCVRNECFPVCAAQETSWATMCSQQYVLVYQESLFETAWPACDTQKVDVP